MALRLNNEAWASIRRLYEAGATAQILAPQFGITPGAIYRKSNLQGWAKAKNHSQTNCDQLAGISQSINRLAAAIEGMNRK
ncbi:helix-turn-helix domain-containing protein [Pseudoduganella sp. R-32]|uniref:helix-turn-helix domain-containing protein n=1 Tax=Pseudoduganella sp. R-32 TaxID=3404061 RepID=UPI003CFA4AB1